MKSTRGFGAMIAASILGVSLYEVPDLGDFDSRSHTRPRQSDGPHMLFVHAKRFDRKMRRRAIAERSRRFNRGRRP